LTKYTTTRRQQRDLFCIQVKLPTVQLLIVQELKGKGTRLNVLLNSSRGRCAIKYFENKIFNRQTTGANLKNKAQAQIAQILFKI